MEQIRDLDLDILLRLGRALADGLQPEIEESLKAIEIVTNVRDTFELIRASDYAINDSQAEVRGCQVLRASKGGGKALRLHYMKRLPEVMVLSTVLVLNATASRMRCDLPFAIYDEFHSMDYQPDIKFFSIRARPHCEKAVCFVKIRNAPGARHHFDEHAWGYLSRSRC